tara:strand:- start:70 stop:264 length:195 start_codon:yes stop_codon:yes gene_type:complete
MIRSKLKALTTHLTIACVLLATLWLLVNDKHVLIIGNSLILVYVVSSLGFCMLPEKEKSKKKKH